MRLWHQSLIPYLPRQQLLGQHRECCALRGKGWGRKHATVNYVFTHDPAHLVAYHWFVLMEMQKRGYHPDLIWEDPAWRGKVLQHDINWVDPTLLSDLWMDGNQMDKTIYPEHNDDYLKECLDNLKSKGIEIII